MRVVHIQKYGRLPILTKCAIPVRSKGQFLIKMKYAPVNPSDIFFYLGLYGTKKQGFPIMGFQGSGVIHQCDQQNLKGRMVSVLANLTNGTYAQYMVSSPSQVIIWPKQTTMTEQQISMCSVNPLSVLGMMDIIQKEDVSTVVVSAATSNTSKMLMKYIVKNQKNIKVYGLSRTPQYDEQLKAAGYREIFRMDQIANLKEEIKNNGKAIFLDCVGGNFAGEVFNALPPKSVMVNYGRLSKENLGNIDLGELYYREKTIRGFWLVNYLREISEQKFQQIKKDVILNPDVFTQKIRKIYPMAEFQPATREAIKDQSAGKILLRMSE